MTAGNITSGHNYLCAVRRHNPAYKRPRSNARATSFNTCMGKMTLSTVCAIPSERVNKLFCIEKDLPLSVL